MVRPQLAFYSFWDSDVDNNSDIFDKEVADGVNCLKFGKMRGILEPLVISGGDCSITGFNL